MTKLLMGAKESVSKIIKWVSTDGLMYMAIITSAAIQEIHGDKTMARKDLFKT